MGVVGLCAILVTAFLWSFDVEESVSLTVRSGFDDFRMQAPSVALLEKSESAMRLLPGETAKVAEAKPITKIGKNRKSGWSFSPTHESKAKHLLRIQDRTRWNNIPIANRFYEVSWGNTEASYKAWLRDNPKSISAADLKKTGLEVVENKFKNQEYYVELKSAFENDLGLRKLVKEELQKKGEWPKDKMKQFIAMEMGATLLRKPIAYILVRIVEAVDKRYIVFDPRRRVGEFMGEGLQYLIRNPGSSFRVL